MSARSRKSSKDLVKTRSKDPHSREYLVKMRQDARRKGCYYNVLKQNERMLLDLTIRVVEKVRSFLLARIISQIVRKLCEAMESRIIRLIRTEGQEMAKSLSRIGEAWGCRAAKSWAVDRGFMQFLVVSNLGVLGN